jgi:phage gp36-like protein
MLATIEYLSKEAGDKEITQLSDLNAIGQRDNSVINDAFLFVDNFVRSFIAIPNNPTPLLKQIAARLALVELRRKNEIFGDKEKELLKECESYLQKMAAGKIPIEIGEEIAASKSINGAYRHGYEKIDASGYRL